MKIRPRAILYLLSSILLIASGCAGNPSAANIQLRKDLQKTREENEELQRGHAADLATIASLKERQTVVTTLPEDRLAKLFSTHGIVLSKLTSADSKALKVFLTPTEDEGQKFKAAGSIVIEAFDLTRPDQQRICQWTFDVDQARSHWNGEMMLYAYVLECPWEHSPSASNLTIKATFTDELTGRVFTAQKQINVNP
jgi:hypothetical protein